MVAKISPVSWLALLVKDAFFEMDSLPYRGEVAKTGDRTLKVSRVPRASFFVITFLRLHGIAAVCFYRFSARHHERGFLRFAFSLLVPR